MYYDLSIPWPVRPSGSNQSSKQSKKDKGKKKEAPQADSLADASNSGIALVNSNDRQQLRHCVEMAIKLGYSCVAFNLLLPPSFEFDPSIIHKLDPCAAGSPPFPELDGHESDKVLQLNRLTFVLDEASLGSKGNGAGLTSSNAQFLQRFSLISVLPLDTQAFSHACLTLSTSIDIITLDLCSSARLPYQLKRSLISKAIADGVVFEITYGPMLRSANFVPNEPGGGKWAGQVPKEARKNLIASARELVRLTDGKGIIISSDLRAALEMRGPSDITNLSTLFGMKQDQSKAALSSRPRATILRGYSYRQAFRGAISKPYIVDSTHSSSKTDRPNDTEQEQENNPKRQKVSQ